MSAEAEAAQADAQDTQVELEYRREEKRENKVMDAKLVAPICNPNLIVRAYGDNLSNGSVKSGGGDRQLPTALFDLRARLSQGRGTYRGTYPLR